MRDRVKRNMHIVQTTIYIRLDLFELLGTT